MKIFYKGFWSIKDLKIYNGKIIFHFQSIKKIDDEHY